MQPPVVFMDTSFIIAMENVHDPYHDKAHELDQKLATAGVRYMLHWGIVLEVGDGFSRLDRRQRGFDLLDRFLNDEGYELIALHDELLDQAVMLFQSRKDKSWGLTDCISFVLMKDRGVTEALTADIHFQQAGFRALLLES